MQGATQILEVKDFSGGITENILGGDPRRYEQCDSLLITTDKMLEMRPAWRALAGDNSRLPTGDQRVTSMFSWLNDTLLVAQSERSFFYYDFLLANTVAMPGVAGNPVLSGADKYAQTTFAEFQKTIYVTSDGGIDPYGSMPAKFYKNDSDVWQGVTAGLPKSFTTGTYTDASLLSAAITLANQIRASMLLHFNDSSGGVDFDTNYLHKQVDTAAINLVSAAPAATDEASLFVLVKALNDAYTAHNNDALIGAYNTNPAPTYLTAPAVHYPIQPIAGLPPVKGPLISLSNVTTPTEVETAATQLDDLRLKWYFHRLAINTHSKFNVWADINKYPVAASAIGRVSIGNTYPVITPDYTDFINYANNLKTIYSGHIGVNSAHNQPPQINTLEFGTNYHRDTSCNAPAATDLDSVYLLIYWLRAAYFVHYTDASVADFAAVIFRNTPVTGNPLQPTLGAGFITGLDSGAAADFYQKKWVTAPPTTASAFQSVAGTEMTNPTGNIPLNASGLVRTRNSQITASGAGATSLTAERTPITTGATDFFGQVSSSWYHFANDGVKAISSANKQTSQQEALGSPSEVGSDISTWLALATEFFNALANHAFNANIHIPVLLSNTLYYAYDLDATWSQFSIQACSTPFFIPELASYSWAFVFAHTYKVGINGLEYQVRSNPVYSDAVFSPVSYLPNYLLPTENVGFYPSVANPATRSTVLSNLPNLVNTPETNYDLANVKLEVYRTANGGTTFYLEKELDLGTSTFTDSANDTLQVGDFGPLEDQDKIYTTGGVLGSDQPPKCKYIHTVNETVYYGAIFDSGQFFPNRILQALQAAPDYAPAQNTINLEDDLVGLSSAKDNPIAFCKNSIHRLQGGFNSTGQGLLISQAVDDELGCVNAKSIVRTEIGVFFAGTTGFYYTDGFQIIPISLELTKTYQDFVQTEEQKRAIYGAYDKANRRVYWSLRADATDTDNSIFYIFYLNYGVKPSGVFTTASSYPYSRISSVVFHKGTLYWGHENGYLMYGDVENKTDDKVDPTLAVSAWGRVFVPWKYKSLAMDTGTTNNRKWYTDVHLIGENFGNVAVQLTAVRDLNYDGNGIRNFKEVNYTQNPWWGTPTCYWGDPNFIWGTRGRMDVWRRFPMRAIRSDYFQLEMAPAFVAVYAVDNGFPFGANAVVDATAKTATILSPAPYTAIVWPDDVVDYVIAFQTDNYTTEFTITALDVTKTIITFADPDNEAVDMPAGVKWVIRGIKKEQRPRFLSYTLHYTYTADSNERYPGATVDSGPGNGGENNN